MKISTWKVLSIVAVLAWTVFTLLPNFVKSTEKMLGSKNKIKYGLDIQGGLHLVMGVDVNGVVTESLKRLGENLKENLQKEGITLSDLAVAQDGQSLTLTSATEGDTEKLKTFMGSNYQTLQVANTSGLSTTFKYVDGHLSSLKKRTVEQSIETIRNRIDEFGVSEPSISAQGEDRILVQLPGIEDSAKAKDLINRTARLEFQIVSNKHSMQEVAGWITEAETKGNFKPADMKYQQYVARLNKELAGKLPPNTHVLFGRDENSGGTNSPKIPYLLETNTNLGGESLSDASVHFGQYGDPQVNLVFNPFGAKRFEELTGANVDRQMAIVLDDVVFSAPNIRTRIAGGSAVIELGRSRDRNAQMNEANTISMALRAGSLPAKLEQLEERTVGPTLGADSIQKGINAGLIGSVLIMIMMIVIYKASGVLASVGVTLNILLTLAILSALDATLTLPGIGGMALTVSMAVDANIIIYERMKEEIKAGRSVEQVIREGFNRAFSAIFDSNVTIALTAFILFYFGTGPVKGFAVTLLIGMATTMFCAVFVPRTVFELAVEKFGLKKISI